MERVWGGGRGYRGTGEENGENGRRKHVNEYNPAGLGNLFQAEKNDGVLQEADAGAVEDRGSEIVAGRACAAGVAGEAVVIVGLFGG